jgi:hypothetical protein
VNTGLALVHRRSIRWDWTEEFLALRGILDGHFWRIEQALFHSRPLANGKQIRAVTAVGLQHMRHQDRAPPLLRYLLTAADADFTFPLSLD